MPFTVFQKPANNFTKATEPRVVMRRNAKHGGTTISFNKPLLDAMKWIPGDRVEVMIGTGADAGTIALRRSPNGYKLTLDGNKTRAKFSATHLFPGHVVESTKCTFQIDGAALVISVPAVFLPKTRTEINFAEAMVAA